MMRSGRYKSVNSSRNALRMKSRQPESESHLQVSGQVLLLHQVNDGRFNLGNVPVRVDTFADNDPQFRQPLSSDVPDRFFRAFDGLLNVQAVQVDSTVRL